METVSKWRIPLNNIFHNQKEVKEHLLLRLAGGTKLRGPADALESRADIQRNWVMLEEWILCSSSLRNAKPCHWEAKRARQQCRLHTVSSMQHCQEQERSQEVEGCEDPP